MSHFVVAVILREHGIIIGEETAREDLGLTSDTPIDKLGLAKSLFERTIYLLVFLNSPDQVRLELLFESVDEFIPGLLDLSILFQFV